MGKTPDQDASATLAALVAQISADGTNLLALKALVEEASERGAARALQHLGLHDANAQVDVIELRQLLSGWRDAKRAARAALIGWAIRVAAAALLLGLLVKLKLLALARLP